MQRKIITISREFGSGGRYIGEQTAKRLGLRFLDREIIVRAAEESHLSESFIEERGEYAPKKSIFSYSFVGRDTQGGSIEDYLYQVQRQVIIQAAREGSCVIVGRCADFILKDRTDSLNVFIHGNMENKIARIMDIYGKSRKEAEKLMAETDRKRSLNYRYYTDQKWGYASNYSMTLNSSEFGYEKCVDVISELFMFGE